MLSLASPFSTGLVATLLLGIASPDLPAPITSRQVTLLSHSDVNCLPQPSLPDAGLDNERNPVRETAQLACPEQLLVSRSTNPFKRLIFRFIPPPAPPKRGAPKGRRGAGSRGDCQAAPNTQADPNAKTVTALMPPDVFGLTTEAQPTLWFHVPEDPQEFHSAAFVLRNSEREELHRAQLSSAQLLSGGSEWVGLSLPPQIEPLEIASASAEDSVYNWTFIIYYCQEDPSASVFVNGSIQRTEATDELQEKLKTTVNPLERAGQTAEAGIWFDTLQHLSEIGCADPSPEAAEALAIAWKSLLTDPNVNLPDLADMPPPNCALPLEL